VSVLYLSVSAVLQCQCCTSVSVLYFSVSAVRQCQCCTSVSVMYVQTECQCCSSVSVLYIQTECQCCTSRRNVSPAYVVDQHKINNFNYPVLRTVLLYALTRMLYVSCLVHRAQFWASWMSVLHWVQFWASWTSVLHWVQFWASWMSVLHWVRFWASWSSVVEAVAVSNFYVAGGNKLVRNAVNLYQTTRPVISSTAGDGGHCLEFCCICYLCAGWTVELDNACVNIDSSVFNTRKSLKSARQRWRVPLLHSEGDRTSRGTEAPRRWSRTFWFPPDCQGPTGRNARESWITWAPLRQARIN
jgi:hypothetical protein